MKSSREQVMTTSNICGNVFDIKRFATHDGHGIRTTLFLKGCPLHCAWCQNPEGLKSERQVLYMENKCIHCGSCTAASTCGGVTFSHGRITLQRSQPEDWEHIVDACPTRALQFDAVQYTLPQIMEELTKDMAFFAHGGGVTISGGEPFAQPRFTIAVLKECKKLGIHTAIETSLYTDLSNLQEALPYLDQIYADLKVFDSDLHNSYTGVDNPRIKENITYLLQSEKRDAVIIRTPLIPDMTASDDNIAAIASYLSSCYHEVQYEILNYNPLAKAKYNYLDMEYCFDENPKLYTKDEMKHFHTIARAHGIHHLLIE